MSTPLSHLEYVDDTLLFAQSKGILQEFLHAIELESSKYGMRLNKKKTIYMVMNPSHAAGDVTLFFADGEKVPVSTHAVPRCGYKS